MIAVVVSLVALAALTAPSVMYLAGVEGMDLDKVKQIMLVATLVWFATAPLYMWKEEKKESS
jgi:hypothetical protein